MDRVHKLLTQLVVTVLCILFAKYSGLSVMLGTRSTSSLLRNIFIAGRRGGRGSTQELDEISVDAIVRGIQLESVRLRL